MSDSDREFIPNHLLSTRSLEQGRNFFMFDRLDQAATLCVGLNLRKHPTVTVSTLYRWLHLAANTSKPFRLFPVEIEKSPSMILCYVPRINGPALLENSNALLVPGDYAGQNIESNDAPCDPLYGRHYSLKPYRCADCEKACDDSSDCASDTEKIKPLSSEYWTKKGWLPPSEWPADLPSKSYHLEKYDTSSVITLIRPIEPFPEVYKGFCSDQDDVFPTWIEDLVRNQEQNCYVTGVPDSSVKLGKTWILPVMMGPDGPSIDSLSFESTSYKVASNVILLREDLIEPFKNNSFGIDVDDNCRVVVFGELGDVSLPSHIPKPEGPDKWFLRHHFRWCLKVHLCGGDIREKYEQQDVISIMEDMGLVGNVTYEIPPPDDPRWHTELGKELLAVQMYLELYDTLNRQ